jgi:hypothetical protein
VITREKERLNNLLKQNPQIFSTALWKYMRLLEHGVVLYADLLNWCIGQEEGMREEDTCLGAACLLWKGSCLSYF